MAKFLDVLLMAFTSAPAALAHRVAWSAERRAAGAMRPAPIPTDTRLRDDIGLPPLAAKQLLPRQRTAAPADRWFPTDTRLRDDIGLPPLKDGTDG